MALPSILVFGSINTDLVTTADRIPEAGETINASSFTIYSGGKGANQAVACARLSRIKTRAGALESPSAVVRMVGCVGDDAFGSKIRNEMEADGVNVDAIEIKTGVPTGVAVVLVEPTGENRILITAGANALCASNLAYIEPAPSLILVQLEISQSAVIDMLNIARQATPPISTLLNPAPASHLPHNTYGLVSHLILNETEAVTLCDDPLMTEVIDERDLRTTCASISQVFLERGVMDSIIITLGSKGAFWYDVKRGQHGVAPGLEVHAVDTTAAGDTFVGAYAVKIVHGATIAEAVAYAVQASARAVTKKGAQQSIPWRVEV